MSKVIATKNETLKCWIMTAGQLTYFGPVAKDGVIKWRAAYNPKRVIDKLEAIAAGTETDEVKTKKTSEAFQSMTFPVKHLGVEVQFGDAPDTAKKVTQASSEDAVEASDAIEAADQTAQDAEPSAPAAKVGKFPKR